MGDDPAEKEIHGLMENEIAQIKQEIYTFKQKMSSISVLPRDLLVKRIYLSRINDFYNSISYDNYELREELEDDSKSKNKTQRIDKELNTLTKLINLNPNKKQSYINQFLENFTMIGVQDRAIIINSIIELSGDELIQSLKELAALFPIP